MASRPIREVQGLNIVYKHINPDKSENGGLEPVKYFAIENKDDLDKAESNHPWILKEVCIAAGQNRNHVTRAKFYKIPRVLLCICIFSTMYTYFHS